ncbi:MAG: hypothetical protein M3Z04_14440 [Chloroflexota bacterium]|nr:hypothetical protein [Chloroflexota bacterium]
MEVAYAELTDLLIYAYGVTPQALAAGLCGFVGLTYPVRTFTWVTERGGIGYPIPFCDSIRL